MKTQVYYSPEFDEIIDVTENTITGFVYYRWPLETVNDVINVGKCLEKFKFNFPNRFILLGDL